VVACNITTQPEQGRQVAPMSSLCILRCHCSIKKTSYFEKIKFIMEDCFTKYTNITTKLSWKLFTKVITKLSKEAWVWDRHSVLIKREAQALLI
jgi:hypothetical protein